MAWIHITTIVCLLTVTIRNSNCYLSIDRIVNRLDDMEEKSNKVDNGLQEEIAKIKEDIRELTEELTDALRLESRYRREDIKAIYELLQVKDNNTEESAVQKSKNALDKSHEHACSTTENEEHFKRAFQQEKLMNFKERNELESFRNTYEYIMAKLTNNVEKVVSKGVLRMMSAESMIHANLSEYMNEAEFRHLKKIEDAEIVTNDAINALNITVKNNKKRETNMLKLIENITSELNEMRTDLHSLLPIGCTTVNGIYSITLENASRNRIPVYCDRVTDGGGWVVFQRRKDGSEDFDRSWLEYKQGFGQPDGEFWLGNELLHQFTSDKPRELRIDMEDFKGKKAHAKYSSFRIYSEKVNYKLEVRGYNGNAGDSLNGVFIGSNGVHNRQSFSTRDNDNDNNESNCATSYLSGWWFKRCYESNLNGKYHSGIHWYSFSSDWSNLKFVEMKFR